MSTIEQGDSGSKVIICFGTKFKLAVEFTAIEKDIDLRNRSALAVNCCEIIHCLEVSCKEDQVTSPQLTTNSEL